MSDAKPMTPEDLAIALRQRADARFVGHVNTALMLQAADACAELARLKAAVPADVAGLVEELRELRDYRPIAEGPPPGVRHIASGAADKLEALARENVELRQSIVRGADQLQAALKHHDHTLKLEVAKRASLLASAQRNDGRIVCTCDHRGGAPCRLHADLDSAARNLLARLEALEKARSALDRLRVVKVAGCLCCNPEYCGDCGPCPKCEADASIDALAKLDGGTGGEKKT